VAVDTAMVHPVDTAVVFTVKMPEEMAAPNLTEVKAHIQENSEQAAMPTNSIHKTQVAAEVAGTAAEPEVAAAEVPPI